MDLPSFSLDEILTAVEKRIPGGRFTANLVFGILLLWLLIVAIIGIVDGLIPLIDFLRFQRVPHVDVKKAASTLLAILALALTALSTSAWLSAVRRRVGSLGYRVHRLNAITSLITLKEEGTELLNKDLTRAEAEVITNWQLRVYLWEEEVVAALKAAAVSAAAISEFRTLVTFQPVGPAINEQHARLKGILAEHLHRLRAIITDLDRQKPSQLDALRRIWPK